MLLRPAKHKNRLNKDRVTLPILSSVRNPLLVCELNFYLIKLRVGVCFPEYIYCRFLEAHFIYLSEILIWSHSEQNWALNALLVYDGCTSQNTHQIEDLVQWACLLSIPRGTFPLFASLLHFRWSSRDHWKQGQWIYLRYRCMTPFLVVKLRIQAYWI